MISTLITLQLKRYPSGKHIAIHDIPGYDPDMHGIYITMNDLIKVLDGKIEDKGNVSISSAYFI